MSYAPAAALLALAGAALMMRSRIAAPADEQGQGDQGWSLDNLTEELRTVTETEPEYMAPDDAANVAAFLMAIRHAEGTAGPDGYRTLFGGGIFSNDYADHPRVAARFTDRAGRTLWTSAAGAFQMMAVSVLPNGNRTKVDTWDRIRRKLGLVDFSPASQDRAAVELIDEAGALADVKAGRFEAAVFKVRKTWASLPGAGYSQGERSIAWLIDRYQNAGGTVA